MQQGDARRATSLFKESLELARDVGDKWAQSSVLGHVGSMYLAQGNYEEAMRYLEEGLALSNEIGNKLSVSLTLYNMALAAQGQGDYERARELYAEGLRSSSTTDDKANTAYCLEGLAQVAAETKRRSAQRGCSGRRRRRSKPLAGPFTSTCKADPYTNRLWPQCVLGWTRASSQVLGRRDPPCL